MNEDLMNELLDIATFNNDYNLDNHHFLSLLPFEDYENIHELTVS